MSYPKMFFHKGNFPKDAFRRKMMKNGCLHSDIPNVKISVCSTGGIVDIGILSFMITSFSNSAAVMIQL